MTPDLETENRVLRGLLVAVVKSYEELVDLCHQHARKIDNEEYDTLYLVEEQLDHLTGYVRLWDEPDPDAIDEGKPSR